MFFNKRITRNYSKRWNMKKNNIDELTKRAEKIFENTKDNIIFTNQGLARRELRILERKGIIEKQPVFKVAKYVGVTPTMQYQWRLVKGLIRRKKI